MTMWVYCPRCGLICKELSQKKRLNPCRFCGADFIVLEPENRDKTWNERVKWIHDTFNKVVKNNPYYSKETMDMRIDMQQKELFEHQKSQYSCPKCGSFYIQKVPSKGKRYHFDKYCMVCYHKF